MTKYKIATVDCVSPKVYILSLKSVYDKTQNRNSFGYSCYDLLFRHVHYSDHILYIQSYMPVWEKLMISVYMYIFMVTKCTSPELTKSTLLNCDFFFCTVNFFVAKCTHFGLTKSTELRFCLGRYRPS
jgi:hypothetical protein